MAAYFGKGRTCRSLSPEEGALLLDKLQETARRITPELLGLLGAYALGGEYAKQLGTFEYGSARGARTIRIIDLGLYPWQAIKMGLPVEKLEPDRDKRRQPVSEFVRQYRDESGTDWDKWLQSNRIELNALTPAASMAWLDFRIRKAWRVEAGPTYRIRRHGIAGLHRVHGRGTRARPHRGRGRATDPRGDGRAAGKDQAENAIAGCSRAGGSANQSQAPTVAMAPRRL